MLGRSGAKEHRPCPPPVERLRLHKLPKTKYLRGFRSTPSHPAQCLRSPLQRGSLKEARIGSESTLTVDLHIDSLFSWVVTPTTLVHRSLHSSEALHSERRLYHLQSRLAMGVQLNRLAPGCTNTAPWPAVLVSAMQPICR